MSEVIYCGFLIYANNTWSSETRSTQPPSELRFLDGGYCPGVNLIREPSRTPILDMPEKQEHGYAALHHVSGWTVLAFWDRSGDKRLGSHSTFAIRGTHEFDEAVALARAAFPSVWQRFRFTVTRGVNGELRPT